FRRARSGQPGVVSAWGADVCSSDLMHATVSGCGDNLAVDDADAIEQAKLFFSYLPTCWREQPPDLQAHPPARPLTADDVPAEEQVPFDMHDVIAGLVDADSFFEVKPLFAAELITGF